MRTKKREKEKEEKKPVWQGHVRTAWRCGRDYDTQGQQIGCLVQQFLLNHFGIVLPFS